MVAIFRFAIPVRKEWSAAEQAEFVRAAAILRGTGLPIICETGVSDEGDPWVIFLREDTGDVIAHIAKIDGQVMAASAATGDVVCGPSFRTVMDKVVRSQPLVLPASSIGDRIHLHPSAVIVAFIATALAWSLDDDARLYDWKVDGDGTVALASGGREPSGNVLRDSLFSKAEASRLGLDAGNPNLSSTLVIAAALAAVAMAADSMDLMLGDDSDRLAALPDTTDRAYAVAYRDANALPGDPQPAALDVAALPGSAGNSPLDSADSAQDGLRWQGASDGFAGHDIKLLFDASRVGPLPELAALPTDKAGLSDGLIESVSLRALPPVSEVSTQEAPTPVAVAAAKHEVDAPAAEPAQAAHAVTQASPSQGTVVIIHGTTITVSSEMFKILGLSSDLAFGPSRPTFSDGPDNHQAAVVSSTVLDASPTEHGAPKEAAETAEAHDSGYRLIDDILWFAADTSHELNASAKSIEALNGALAALAPYLPTADRILIIDIPDLNADFFKFVDGLTMMSQKAAEKLMPSLELHAQAELALSNGETLKLMGVIDLHDYPTLHA
jgi:hypothetical protein